VSARCAQRFFASGRALWRLPRGEWAATRARSQRKLSNFSSTWEMIRDERLRLRARVTAHDRA